MESIKCRAKKHNIAYTVIIGSFVLKNVSHLFERWFESLMKRLDKIIDICYN